MMSKFYKFLTWFCALFGKLGDKIRFWAEYKEYEYYSDTQVKIIDLPDDKMISVHYNRKGDTIKVNFSTWNRNSDGDKRGWKTLIESIDIGSKVLLIGTTKEDSE